MISSCVMLVEPERGRMEIGELEVSLRLRSKVKVLEKTCVAHGVSACMGLFFHTEMRQMRNIERGWRL